MTLIHDTFYFSYSYGMGFILSLSGLCLSSIALMIFESSKAQYYVIAIDVSMLTASITALIYTRTPFFWVMMPFFTATYCILFSAYPFVRVYHLLSQNVKIFGYVGYFLTYVACMVYGLSARGFLSSTIGFYAYLSIMPFMFCFGGYLLLKIVFMIRNNPMARENGKQTRLLVISYYTIIFAFCFAGPCSFLAIGWGIF
eukprot:NODE_253_length_11722_cov_0.375118.p11 type:complete len:199 gc:universal NODE_253_length_11722_cov_0.375118:2267-1671(-)